MVEDRSFLPPTAVLTPEQEKTILPPAAVPFPPRTPLSPLASASAAVAAGAGEEDPAMSPAESAFERDYARKLEYRYGTGAIKLEKYAADKTSVLPLWVADSDFLVAPAITKKMHERVDHGMFGYSLPTANATKAALDYLASIGVEASSQEILWLPGLVYALGLASRAFAEPGQGVACFTPVYPPLFTAADQNDRVPVRIPLKREARFGMRWTMDLDALKARVENLDFPRVTCLLLCNPHNPIARAFQRDELEELLRYCASRRITVVSDEVHADLIMDARVKHVPAHAVDLGPGSTKVSNFVVSLHSPSKTFNIAGLCSAFAVVKSPVLLKKLRHANRTGADVNVLGLSALEAAYSPEAAEWRDGMLAYLRGNLAYLKRELPKRFPMGQIRLDVSEHEATYLAWLDCSLVPQIRTRGSAYDFFLKEAKVALNDGRTFYSAPKPVDPVMAALMSNPQNASQWAMPPDPVVSASLKYAPNAEVKPLGGHHVRLNFACHRDVLREALDRMEKAVKTFKHGEF